MDKVFKVGFGLTQFNRGSLIGGIDGIGNYSYELMSVLGKNPELEIFPFSFGYPFSVQTNNNNSVVLNRLRTHLIKATINPYSRLSKLHNTKVDLIHASDHLVPISHRIPVVATIMDAIPISNPEWVAGQANYVTRVKYAVWKRLVRSTNEVITASQYSKSQIAYFFDIAPEKISVIPLAVDSRFYEVIHPAVKAQRLKELKLPASKFFLNVGTMQPRKNVLLILEAMERLTIEFRKEYPLVIIGRVGWKSENIEAAILKAVEQGWCHWLKRVSDFDLRCLLQSSSALLFPSLSEGFGLPVLEAFASQTPVITSNISSLPEVGGDAALYIDPLNPDDLAEKMLQVVNHEISSRMVSSGLIRSRQFTWDRCATETVSVYKRLIT